MEVKIDTREKFTVVTPILPEFTANIAAAITTIGEGQLRQAVKNIVLNMGNTASMTEEAARSMALLQQTFYESSASFVICCLNKTIETSLENWELLDVLNTTPTESEAWDIVQMEEIERELLDGEDIEFDATA